MSLLMRRRMLLAQKRKSSNLFDESLFLTNKDITKVDNGYSINGYPAQFSRYNNANNPVIKFFRSLKADTDYTIAYEVLSIGAGSAGSFRIQDGSPTNLFSVGGSVSGKKVGTFNFTQEQINSIYYINFYGTSQGSLANGASPTIITNFQLLEGKYTKDTIPPYEPYEE